MATKKDIPLLKTIEAQKEQLKRYETRLKDLVRAHKGLLKENQALQASVTALTASASDNGAHCASSVTDEDVSRNVQHSAHDSPTENGLAGTQSQLETLRESLQTMVKEKSRMESSFMADRKSLRSELDKCHGELESCRKELADTRDNFLKIQSDRESETSQYNSALREVQQLLMEERSTSAQLKEQCSQQKHQLQQIAAADQHVSEVEKIVARWKQCAEELENTVSDREDHVCRLEEQVSQLSVSLGRHQQQSAADQSTIARLKERLVQLDVERLSRDQAVTSPSVDDVTDGCKHVLQLVDTTRELIAARPAEVTNLLQPLRDLLIEFNGLDSEQSDQLNCRPAEVQHQQRRSNQEQPEQNTSFPPASNSPSESEVRQQTEIQLRAVEDELKKTLRRLKLTCEERDQAERSLKQLQIRTEQDLADLQCAHRGELASLAAGHRDQLNQLERRLSSQKLKLSDQLAESQAELHELKRHTGADTVTSLDHISFTKQEANILHYVEEVARRDVEIVALRRSKNQLEISLRQLQNKMIDREESLGDQIDFLKERIKRLELNVSREGANLEYIKNVMVRYFLTDDVTQRAHMLNALATSLRFSDDELGRCRRSLTASWWPSIAS